MIKYRLIIVIIVCSTLLLQVHTVKPFYNLKWDTFYSAVLVASGKKPTLEIFNYFKEATKQFFTQDLAMFLAQIIYESKGFTSIEDLKALKNNKDQQNYHENGIGVANKSYHGRGYLMLTWAGNYKAASEDLFGNPDTLLNDPDLLLNKTIAMKVSVWYWKTLVEPVILENRKKCKSIYFGIATNIISHMRGSSECDPNTPGNQKARARFNIYKIVAKAFQIKHLAYAKGCYN